MTDMYKKAFIIWLGTLVLFATPGWSESPSDYEQDSMRLIQDLRKGGYIFIIRHERKLPGPHAQTDQDCQKSELTLAGQELSKDTGVIIRSLEIPVSKVISSPSCRCRETANLMFGTHTTKPILAIVSQDFEKRKKETLKYLQSLSKEKTNIALITHISNIGLLFQKRVYQGDTLILKFEKDQFIVHEQIPSGRWPELHSILTITSNKK